MNYGENLGDKILKKGLLTYAKELESGCHDVNSIEELTTWIFEGSGELLKRSILDYNGESEEELKKCGSFGLYAGYPLGILWDEDSLKNQLVHLIDTILDEDDKVLYIKHCYIVHEIATALMFKNCLGAENVYNY